MTGEALSALEGLGALGALVPRRHVGFQVEYLGTHVPITWAKGGKRGTRAALEGRILAHSMQRLLSAGALPTASPPDSPAQSDPPLKTMRVCQRQTHREIARLPPPSSSVLEKS